MTLVAALLGVGVGLNAASTWLLASAVLAGQLSVGWSNDALDAARDRANGRADKPAATGQVTTRALWRAAALSGCASLVLSAPLGTGAVHLLLPAAGWAYNLGLKNSWWSGAAYAVGFASLPAAPYLMLEHSPAPPWWVPTAGALLGVGAHVANVLPDLRSDLATEVRGMPHRIGARASIVVMAVALFGAVAASAFGPTHIDLSFAVASTAVAGGLTAVTVATAWRRPDSRVTFLLVLGLALLVAAQFTVGV